MVDQDLEKLQFSPLQALEEKLRSAEKEIAENSRGAAITALQGTIDFINSVPHFEPDNLALPLAQLMAALHDLDCGRVVPMVKPTQVDNRKPEASFRKVIRAFAIFCIEELMNHGMLLEEACKFVTQELVQAKVPIGGQRDTRDWKTIKGWRYDHTRLGANDQEHKTLEGLRRECQFPQEMPLEQLKDRLSKLLPIILPKTQAGLE
jgi:hypothetical protein